MATVKDTPRMMLDGLVKGLQNTFHTISDFLTLHHVKDISSSSMIRPRHENVMDIVMNEKLFGDGMVVFCLGGKILYERD